MPTTNRRPLPAILATVAAATALVSCATGPATDSGPAPTTSTATPTASPSMPRATADPRQPSDTTIALRVGAKTYRVQLYDNPTARDLATQLPLTVNADDYPGYDEKLLRLPRPLSMGNAPDGDDPKIPEVGYYHPGQWIALYYGPTAYWAGKVPPFRIVATVDELRAIPADTPVTLERLAG